ncbi:MAG TPA: DUF192 domain-containing protein [archaeon]|nr:DUF192 domain-containing protein [archaeon]
MVKKRHALAGLAVVLAFAYASLLSAPQPGAPPTAENKQLTLPSGGAIELELACTPNERSQGLSNRSPESLPRGRGMLFAFDSVGERGFWMKEMEFALDIAWIDAGKRVSFVEEGVPPCTPSGCPVYSHAGKYVLEVNAGEAKRLGISAGAVLAFDAGC